MQWNEQQARAIAWPREGQGSLVIEALAGCGKTATLIGMVDAISRERLGSVALMAFNKSAAVEFESRLKLLDPEPERVDTGTVHSFGYRAIRNYGFRRTKVTGYKTRDMLKKYPGQVYQEKSAAIEKLVSLAKQQAFGVGINIEDPFAWGELADHFDVDLNSDPMRIIEAAIRVYHDSTGILDQVIDFDDMIVAPLLLGAPITKYDFVMIDEAQDTNRARRLLAYGMMKDTSRLVAVGDRHQAIYGFTGADSDSLDQIAEHVNATRMPLSITYRCPKVVVAEANRIVPELEAHETAPEGEVTSMQASATDSAGTTSFWYTSQALTGADSALCRLTRPLIAEAYSMIRAGYGCRVEGRDIGENLIALATKWKQVKTLSDLDARLLTYFNEEMDKLQGKQQLAKAQVLEDKCQTLQAIIEYLQDEGFTLVDDLVRHVRSLFSDTAEDGKPAVFTFSTIHKAKGREWDRVYLLHKSTTMPSKWAKQPWQQEQERNLEYVAITRAKRVLTYVD